MTTFRNGQVTITDFDHQDTTMGVTFGGGVRIPAWRRMTVTPEIRIYDGTILAGANLAQLRTSIAVGYPW